MPDENEWYKAAYYDPSLSGANKYWFYPTRSNNPPSADPPPGGTNSANYFGPNGYVLTQSTMSSSTQNYLTDVGAYIGSPSPYGTFDQGGDVFQWNDLDATFGSSVRGYRGGDFAGDSFFLDSTVRFTVTPVFSNYTTGFRVAGDLAVPEPGSATLLLTCGIVLGAWRLGRNGKHRVNFRRSSYDAIEFETSSEAIQHTERAAAGSRSECAARRRSSTKATRTGLKRLESSSPTCTTTRCPTARTASRVDAPLNRDGDHQGGPTPATSREDWYRRQLAGATTAPRCVATSWGELLPAVMVDRRPVPLGRALRDAAQGPVRLGAPSIRLFLARLRIREA